MSLDLTRPPLRGFLLENSQTKLASVSEWQKLEELTQAWFTDLKDWESDDTFNAAYQGERMTVRAISGGHQKADSFRTIDVSPIDKDGNTPKTAPLSTVGLRSGKDGIQMRMDPANLWKRGTQVGKNWSGKYEHGLHDMNASLLNPRRPWYQLKAGDGRIGQNGLVESQYGQMKPYIGGLYVFMPLPQEADLEIFFILNGLAKTTASPEWFKDSMRWRGQRLTRIKFAQERDMAVKYWDVGSLQGLGRVKITMGGVGGLADYKTNPEDTKYAPATSVDIAKRRELVTRYRTILKDGADAQYNEVIIAYRSHGNPNRGSRFPVYATMASSKTGLIVDAAQRQVITSAGALETVSQEVFARDYQ
jgi:hypothetical protein